MFSLEKRKSLPIFMRYRYDGKFLHILSEHDYITWTVGRWRHILWKTIQKGVLHLHSSIIVSTILSI